MSQCYCNSGSKKGLILTCLHGHEQHAKCILRADDFVNTMFTTGKIEPTLLDCRECPPKRLSTPSRFSEKSLKSLMDVIQAGINHVREQLPQRGKCESIRAAVQDLRFETVGLALWSAYEQTPQTATNYSLQLLLKLADLQSLAPALGKKKKPTRKRQLEWNPGMSLRNRTAEELSVPKVVFEIAMETEMAGWSVHMQFHPNFFLFNRVSDCPGNYESLEEAWEACVKHNAGGVTMRNDGKFEVRKGSLASCAVIGGHSWVLVK